MPRKTRKQKERAAQRRSAYTEHERVYSEPGRTVNREFSFRPDVFQESTIEFEQLKKADKSHVLPNRVLNMADLVKSLVLAILIFSLELVIYWARVKSALF